MKKFLPPFVGSSRDQKTVEMKAVSTLFIAVLCMSAVLCDIYLHGCGMPGSNNRISATGINANNRLFDSQNNGKGGYGLRPKMHFMAGSELQIQWTNQHGCGNNPNVHCNMVLQYMCADSADEIRDGRRATRLQDNQAADIAARNNKIPDVNDAMDCDKHESGANRCDGEQEIGGVRTYLYSQSYDRLDLEEVDANGQVYEYGQHESYAYYNACKTRDRNGGLFTATLNVNNNRGATATRQNRDGNNGDNNGWECPEERDYYPYWHPSPWVDVAVLTDDTDKCEWYLANSQNTNPVNYCSMPKYNNEKECTDNGGSWLVEEPKDTVPVECLPATFSRDNHLGNGGMEGPSGVKTPFYTWVIPDIAKNFCVFRVRYNVSTSDYDRYNTTSDDNKGQSPIDKDPVKHIGLKSLNMSVRINVDETQFGRVFQDRSHVFAIKPRPEGIGSARVVNVNVRGERGNIVQVYPSTEYDYCPAHIRVSRGDYIDFQFSGTDTNPSGNDGNGKRRTCRSNVIELKHSAGNYPVEYTGEESDSDYFFNELDAAVMGYLNQVGCDPNVAASDDDDDNNCYVLNRSPRYFRKLHRVTAKDGTYFFASSRNNDFSNRSHKLTIEVGSPAERVGSLLAWAF